MLTPLLIPGYELTEVIHEGINTIVYRGKLQTDQQKVILKILKTEYPTIDAIACLKHEYKIAENPNHQGIVKVLRLFACVEGKRYGLTHTVGICDGYAGHCAGARSHYQTTQMWQAELMGVPNSARQNAFDSCRVRSVKKNLLLSICHY